MVRAGDRSREKRLLDILTGEETSGHVHAAESLFKVGSLAKDQQDLLEAFEHGEDYRLRLMAAAALGKAGNPQAMVFLRDSVVSDEADRVRTAAWILGVRNKSDINLLKTELTSVKSDLDRAFLNHALAALGDKSGLEALAKNLDAEDAVQRTYAATFAADAKAVTLAQN